MSDEWDPDGAIGTYFPPIRLPASMNGLADEDIQPSDRLVENLRGTVDVTVGAPGQEEQLIDALAGHEVVLVTSRVPITRRVLADTDLRIVAKIGTGIDNVDLDAARDLKIPVTYTPGANALAVAEHTVTLLLSVSHRLSHAQDILRSGGWRDQLEPGRWLYGKTVGIIGFGNVGSRVARLLSGFQVRTLAYDPYVSDLDTEYTGTTLTSLDELLEASDAVCVNAELTEETRGLLGADAFDAMKETAYLVNTARGPIVDEAALIEALETGTIAGAGLDVFEQEPLPDGSPLLDFDDVIVTPHSAGAITESRERSIDLLCGNVSKLIDGEPVEGRYLAVAPDW